MGWFRRRSSRETPPPEETRYDRWSPTFWPDLEELVPPRDLWVGPDDPVSHFLRWAWEYRAYLVLLCGLRSSSSVLEIGCNHGRTMLGLVDLLRPPGRYEGLDILPAQVEFAQREIQSRHPHLRFTVADVFNGTYNPAGSVSADEFIFPYAEDSFDIAYAASVYTHLLPKTASNYFRETRRVLRPGGKCLYSFFVLDRYEGKGTSACDLYEFEHPVEGQPGVAVHDPANPEAVIAYSRDRIDDLARQAGLEVERILPGFWTATEDPVVSEQDLVLFRASGDSPPSST